MWWRAQKRVLSIWVVGSSSRVPIRSLTSPWWQEVWTSRHLLVERIVVCLRLLHRPACSPNEPTYSGLGPHEALPHAWLTKLLRAMSGSADFSPGWQVPGLGHAQRWSIMSLNGCGQPSGQPVSCWHRTPDGEKLG